MFTIAASTSTTLARLANALRANSKGGARHHQHTHRAANVALPMASLSQREGGGGGFVGAAVRVGAALTLSAAVVFSGPGIAQAGLNKNGNQDAYAVMMAEMEAQRWGAPYLIQSHSHDILPRIFVPSCTTNPLSSSPPLHLPRLLFARIVPFPPC
jgi:hypothetical protein